MRWPMSRSMSRPASRPMCIGDGALKPFELASLFKGEAGFLWPDLPYHQDPAGTTEAVWGNPVGLIGDDSGNGAEFTQPTVTARPVLGRVPVGGRRNLLTGTDETNQWRVTQGNGSAVGEGSSLVATISEEPTPHFRGLGGGVTQGFEYTYSATLIKIPNCTNLAQLLFSVDGFDVRYYNIDLDTGQVVHMGGGATPSSITVVPSAEGWRASVTLIANVTTVARMFFAFLDSGERPRIPPFIADETYRYVVRDVQGEERGLASPYQSVSSEYDITESGVESVHYIHLDGVDDSIATTLPAIANGTLVLAGTNGIWIDDQYNHAGGTFSIGPTTYTNGPAGILPVIGDLIVGGSFAIDRQLTTQERTRVINKLKSMGAPGVFELGPELNSNSGPNFLDATGWLPIANAELYVADGELRAKNTTLQFGRARRNITGIEPGQNYLASFSTRGVVGTPTTFLGYSSGNQSGYFQAFNTTPLTMSVAITAVSGEDNIMFNLQNTNTSEENEGAVIYYSLRKLELIP